MSKPKDISKAIVTAISSVIGKQKVPLHEPLFKGQEWQYLKNCLNSTYVSSVGSYVKEFETSLANFTGSDLSLIHI